MPIEIENGEETINTNNKKKITRGKKTDITPENEVLVDKSEQNDGFSSHPDYPPYIKYSSNKDKFKCDECDKELLKQHVDRHVKAYHTTQSEKEVENEVKNDKIKEIDDLLKKKREIVSTNEFVTPEKMVYDTINKDIADGATKIAKNIHLQFLYIETKKVFPPDWTFEDWVHFLITYALDDWGISYGVKQNMEDLSESQLEMLRKAELDWEKVNTNG